MRKELEDAVREHSQTQHGLTGYFLVTFDRGQATVSGQSDEHDEIAAEIIRLLADAMGEEPDDDDEIGPCRGTA